MVFAQELGDDSRKIATKYRLTHTKRFENRRLHVSIPNAAPYPNTGIINRLGEDTGAFLEIIDTYEPLWPI